MTMKTKTTNIAQWVLSIPKVPDKGFLDEGIYEYLERMDAIDKKIASLMDKLNAIADREEIDWGRDTLTHTMVTLYHVSKIRDAIGVYSIHDVTHKNIVERPLWTKYSKDNSNSNYVRNLSYTSGHVWLDYFGDYEGITKLMKLGIVNLVVSLSDEGVEYLNGIDKEATSSYITV